MPSSFRSLIGASVRILSQKLASLNDTLIALQERLHQVVAEAVAKSISAAAQEALLRALDAEDDAPSWYARAPGSTGSTWRSPEQSHWDTPWSGVQGEESYRYTSVYPQESTYDSPSQPQALTVVKEPRWPGVLAVGLRAAAWWLKSLSGPWLAAGAFTAGVAAAGAAYIGGTVVEAVLSLAESASRLSALAALTRLMSGRLRNFAPN